MRIVTVLSIAAATAPVAAQTLPITSSVVLVRGVDVRIEVVGDDTHVTARAGRRVSTVSFPGHATEATVERVATTEGPVAIVRASGAGAYAVLIVARSGAPEIAWWARTDLHGDPGERVQGAIELEDRTGDGLPDVVVGERREGIALCGAPNALLFARGLDPHGELRPVTLRRVGGDGTALAATIESPGPALPPLGSSLRMLTSSSAVGVEDASGLRPPRALTDGDPATSWSEGRPGAGAGEMVVAQLDRARPIRAFAVRASSAPDVVPPRALWLIGDSGETFHVSLPPGPFDRAYVVPPAPVAWSCLSVVLDPGLAETAGLRVGLGEIEAYTDVDFGGGVSVLVDALVAEQADAERTTDWLARIGVPAIEALEAAWDRLSSLGRRRAVRVASAHAEETASARVFTLAAADQDSEVRADAWRALTRSGASGAAALAAIASGTAPGAEEAAWALIDAPVACDVRILLSGIAGPGSERPALRAAIGARLSREPRADAEAALVTWLETADPGARASVALGLAGARPDLARVVIEHALDQVTAFEARFRLVQAASGAEPSTRIDDWLAEVATHADEWMLRDAALATVGPRRADTLTRALGDPYPRVRSTAVRLLATIADATPALLDLAQSDGWPMVRVAALDGLRERSEELPTLRRALADDSPMVREHALIRLVATNDVAAWAPARERLLDDHEWPRVVAAALGLASALCVTDGADAIDRVMVRGTRPSAWAPNTDVAVLALRVALRLGGETAERARLIASRSTQVESFQPTLDGRDPLPPCAAAAPPVQ